jgi:hypothetical protein
MQFAGSLTSAIDFKAVVSDRAKQELGEDTALRVANAKKEDAKGGKHTPSLQINLARFSRAGKVVTKLSQSFLWRGRN